LQYNFEGNYDIVRFFKEIQHAGMYAILRIGPYICGEWNYGYQQISSIIFISLCTLIDPYCSDCLPVLVAEAFPPGCVTSPACSSGCTMTPSR